MEDQLPELSKEEVDDVVKNFKKVFQNSLSLESAYIREVKCNFSFRIILSVWKQRNLERGVDTKFLRTILQDENSKTGINVTTTDVSNCLLTAYSKSESLKAVINCIQNGREGKPKYFLEIWNNEKSLMVFDITALETHGLVYTDEVFGCLTWSPQEDKVAYVAERNPPKATPFYQQKSKKDFIDHNSEKDSGPLIGEQYTFTDDWGEQMTPRSQSAIVVCNVTDQDVSIMNGIPDSICPGQVMWHPNGDGLVGIGINHEPQRLGIKFCSNRHSCIFHLSFDGKYSVLSDETNAVLSPRISPSGKYLVWLQRAKTGPHATNVALMKYEWNTKIITTLIDFVDVKIKTKNGKTFYGMFTLRLPPRCWTMNSSYIVFNSIVGTRMSSFMVHVDDGSIWDISMDENESTSVCDVTEDGFAVFNVSSFKQPSVMKSVNLASFIEGKLTCNVLTKSLSFDENIICDFEVCDFKTKEKRCDASYFGPAKQNGQSIPVILFLHGGPHGCIVNSFSSIFQFLCQLGFGIVIPHYRGSLGFGKAFVDALPGQIGSLDVEDCYAALQNAYMQFPWLDKDRAILEGGSHGGFLVAHLIGQYPNEFISAVTINPVTHLPSKFYTTDIPDWSAVETGHSYEGLLGAVQNDELWKKMVDVSPIRYIKDVKTPTMLMIGKKDLRVPPSQGLLYYHMLKELKVPTKLLLYDDNHSLSSVPVEMDSVINAAIWIKRCIKRKILK